MRYALGVFCLALSLLGSARESVAAPARVNLIGTGQQTVKAALAAPLTGPGIRAEALGAELQGLIAENLGILPFIEMTDPRAVLGGIVLQGTDTPNLDFRRFQLAGAAVLLTASWPNGDGPGKSAELRVFDTSTGQRLFAALYPDLRRENLADAADQFCAGLLEVLIGNGDFFRSTLVFIKDAGRTKSDVWVMRPTGRGLKQVTNMPGKALSPAWSLDGRFVVFSHIDDRSHALGVWDRNSGQVQCIRFPGNTVIGPSFTPENKVAVALSQGRNPDIFLLNHAFQVERTLESHPSINVSPSMNAAGNRMAFTSSRMGGPQIFLKDMVSGAVTRVSREGGYNSEPNLSRDGTLLVYTRMTDFGQRIFAQDLQSGQERQITFGPGSDEHPSFSPDGYFIAFASTRGGERQIYLTTRYGAEPKHLRTGGGNASFPRWGIVK
jgi:TolB protein